MDKRSELEFIIVNYLGYLKMNQTSYIKGDQIIRIYYNEIEIIDGYDGYRKNILDGYNYIKYRYAKEIRSSKIRILINK